MDDLNICYTPNNAYLPYVFVSCCSVMENNKKKEQINFFILVVGSIDKRYIDWAEHYFMGKRCNIFIYEVDEYISKLKNITAINLSCPAYYSRIFIGSILPDNVKYCYYLDVDTIVCSELESKQNTKDFCIYAVKDTWNSQYNQKIGFAKADTYYNTGVLYIDIDIWRKKQYEAKILQHLQKLQEPYLLYDQDLLNVVCKNQIGVLPPEYNALPAVRSYSYDRLLKYSEKLPEEYYSYEEIERAKNIPIVIHYAGGYLYDKPWKKYCSDPDVSLWRYYYRLCGIEEIKEIECYKGIKHIKKMLKYIVVKLMPQKILWIIDSHIMNSIMRRITSPN